MNLPFNPFSILTSKIFAGALLLAVGACSVQTVRIEGIYCSDPKDEEAKPACLIRGFKQELSIVRIDLRAARARTEAEMAKHAATKKAYRDAQAEAELLEQQRLARVSQQQKEITDAIVEDYELRLADARARAERLRRQAGWRGGALGSTARNELSGAGGSSGGADEAAGGARLSIDQRLIATEQALQLDELQSWLRRQLSVPIN